LGIAKGARRASRFSPWLGKVFLGKRGDQGRLVLRDVDFHLGVDGQWEEGEHGRQAMQIEACMLAARFFRAKA
jgi:hypothetical protein